MTDMRKKLYSTLYNMIVDVQEGIITPHIGMVAQAYPHSPRYKKKNNKFDQPYNHWMEYINRYHAFQGAPLEHEVMPLFSNAADPDTEEPDLRQFLNTLPAWPELGYKISNYPNRPANFYNPVALATLFWLETGILVSPFYVEDCLKADPKRHPLSINLKFCQQPLDPKERELHTQSLIHLGNKYSC